MRARSLSKIASHRGTQFNDQTSKRNEEVLLLTDEIRAADRVETVCKIGSTTYIVNGIYASEGAAAVEKIKRLLDRKTKK